MVFTEVWNDLQWIPRFSKGQVLVTTYMSFHIGGDSEEAVLTVVRYVISSVEF